MSRFRSWILCGFSGRRGRRRLGADRIRCLLKHIELKKDSTCILIVVGLGVKER
jgi:hypothetical protein